MEVGHGPGQPGRAHLPPHRAGGEAEQLSGGQAAAVLAESARDQEDLGMSSYLDVKMMRMIMAIMRPRCNNKMTMKTLIMMNK